MCLIDFDGLFRDGNYLIFVTIIYDLGVGCPMARGYILFIFSSCAQQVTPTIP